MRNLSRSLLSLTLSFSLAIPPQAFANSWTPPSDEQILEAKKYLSPEEQSALDQILKQVSTLRSAFANPEGPAHGLDEFDLIQQEVVDARQIAIEERIQKVQEEDFAIRRKEEVDFLREQALKNPSRTIEFIGAKQVQLAADHLGVDSKRDLLQIIEAAYTDDTVAKIFDIQPDSVEHFVDEDLPPRRLYRMNLKVHVVKSDAEKDEVVKVLNQKDAVGSAAASFNSPTLYQTNEGEELRFDIATSKGEVIHRFNRPVAAVGFYGRFLVYVDKESLALKFIDLDYFKGAIGNTPLAAFELPLKISQLDRISIRNGQVQINEKAIPYSAFELASELYQAYFNIKVGLLDPKTASSSSNLIQELVHYKDHVLSQYDSFETEMISSALNGMESITSLVDEMTENLDRQAQAGVISEKSNVPQALKKALENEPEMMITFNPTIKVIEEETLRQSRLVQINRSIMVSRQFMSRLHLLMAKLNHPQPMGSPKVLQGMIMLAESGLAGDLEKAKQNWKDLKKHPVVAYGRFGAPALAAAAIGASISDSFAMTIYETLQMGKDTIAGYLEHTDYGLNFVRLMGEAAGTAAQGPAGFLDYFTSEKLPRLAVLGAAMSGLVVSIYGSLHLTANISTAARYFSRHKRWINKARADGMSRLGAYRAAFIKYQNALRLYYDKGLAAAEAGAANNASYKFNDAQDAVAEEILAEIKKRPGRFARVASALKGVSKVFGKKTADLQEAGDKGEELVQSLEKKSHLNKITTLRAAFAQFALSYPSTVITSRFNGTLWNYWFMIRTFALSPKSWPMFLTYPELFRTGIDGQEGRVHMPSKLNGGYRSDLENFKFVFRNLNTDRTLKDLKVFEKAVLPVEALAYEVALEKSLEVLMKEMKDPKQLKAFFDSSALSKSGLSPGEVMGGAAPSTGIRSISDAKIKRLSKKNQTLFRAVFNKLYEKITETYLRDYMSTFAADQVNQAQSVSELKDVGIDQIEQMDALRRKLKSGGTASVQSKMKAIANDLLKDGKIVEESKKLSESLVKMGERFLLNLEHDVIKRLDPNTQQISRFRLAERKLGSLKSVIRAVNAMATEIVMEKGGSLLMILVMYSAVTSGMLAPLQPDMFGPDSWFYGSRYLFLNGFATAVIMSAMASVWMKVQMDDRIDSTGAFDKVPTTKDRDRSYLRYYLKSFFKNPTNKWSSNQVHSMKIAWANLSAAFVTIAVTNFLTLGRFDLGAFLTGYMIYFFTPLAGIDYKIDQTHELASRWQASKIMRKLRAHPKMQEWINKNVLMKRYPHSAFSTAYNFFMGPFVSLYELMDTAQFGKRSFLNLLLNGYQPEEIVSKGLQGVNKLFGWVPGVENVTTFCENLLTNNNTALDPSKLMNPPVKGGN